MRRLLFAVGLIQIAEELVVRVDNQQITGLAHRATIRIDASIKSVELRGLDCRRWHKSRRHARRPHRGSSRFRDRRSQVLRYAHDPPVHVSPRQRHGLRHDAPRRYEHASASMFVYTELLTSSMNSTIFTRKSTSSTPRSSRRRRRRRQQVAHEFRAVNGDRLGSTVRLPNSVTTAFLTISVRRLSAANREPPVEV